MWTFIMSMVVEQPLFFIVFTIVAVVLSIIIIYDWFNNYD